VITMAERARYGLAVLSDVERKFVEDLDALGCPIWYDLRDPRATREFRRRKGWQDADANFNSSRWAGFEVGDCLCVNTGKRIVVVDVDPRNGGDIDAVRTWLDRWGIRIFAEVITPSGGRHFYIAGSPGLTTVHGRLPGLPGVDLQAEKANVFLPGMLRPKYGGKGYKIVFNDLDTLRTDGDHDGAQALTAYLAEYLSKKRAATAPGQPWDGTPPDHRQQRYLDKVLTEEVKSVANATPGRRNDGLNAAGFKLGGYIAGAGLDRQGGVADQSSD
jgi:Bifunctional DNA primase/polymerase, N-terminal